MISLLDLFVDKRAGAYVVRGTPCVKDPRDPTADISTDMVRAVPSLLSRYPCCSPLLAGAVPGGRGCLALRAVHRRHGLAHAGAGGRAASALCAAVRRAVGPDRGG